MIHLKTIVRSYKRKWILHNPVKRFSNVTKHVFDYFRHFSFKHFPSSQSGIAYIAILVLLAILSTVTFSFLFKASTQTQATMTRSQSMQAHYLAESAANHALWGLLNQPGFAPASDVYYMHSLANGRYGYKVRKPTETTFATVATVGAIENNVVNQSYVQYIIPSNVLTAYARTTTPHVQYRRLIGANWTNPADTPDTPVSTVYWVEMEGCPVRKEIIMGTIDGQDDINLVVWDGTSWGNPHVFSTVNAGTGYKRFDVAYESQSGRALVVSRYDDTTTVRYNIWDGTAWLHATAQPAFNLAGGEVRLVVMASCPGNDQILIATVNSLFDLQLFLWNGSVFTDLGVIETSTYSDQPGTVQIVYERQSGDALVIWTIWGSTPKFRVWNGATLGPENIVPVFPNDVYFLRAASDPTSDHIVVAGVDKFYDVQVGIWNGTAWTDSREVETDNANQVRQGVDVAWEATGEDALVVWVPWKESAAIVRSLAWKKGTALADSTVEPGPDAQSQPWLVRLLPISQSEKIILLAETNTNELRYSLWDGDRLKGDPGVLLESNITVQNQLAFDLAEANVPISGGTGSGAIGNQPPTVDAGLDQTIYLPMNQVDLDGTVTDDGLPNPPATVDTTWSKISGPGTVTFGNPSLVDTTATFSEAGTYVLRLTADDSELSDFDEVTITVDSCGLLFVVASTSGLSSEESQRKTMMEGWGWTVTLIDDGDSQANFDVAAAANDMAYVSQQAVATMLGSKLNNTPIGVVNENKDMIDDFGFATGVSMGGGLPTLNVDMTHYITSVFTANPVVPYVANDWYQIANEPVATGVDPVGTWVEAPYTDKPALMALSMGDTLIGGGTASGRRVQIPWGSGQGATPVALASLSDDAKTIMKRAIQWAANEEGGCGGGSGSLLFIVDDASNLSAQDNAKKGLMEGWGWTVTLISASATQAEFDAVASSVDVAYVSDEIDGSELGTKLKEKTIGVVNEDPDLHSVFGFSSVRYLATGNPSLNTDSAHYITSPFGGSTVLALFTANQPIGASTGTLPSGLEIIGTWASGTPSSLGGLLVLENGAVISGGGTAAGRRVQTPWGGQEGVSAIDINSLTSDGLTIMKRAIEWAAGATGGGGGGSDTDPPTPDPMTWASPPAAEGPYSISMTATTASDPSGVEYYFECTAGGGNDSGWQDSPKYADTGLSTTTSYTYRVKARDKSASQNETGWSTEASATTSSNEIYVYDITMGYGTAPGSKYFGRATVWIKSASGQNISGATVSGDWSGVVSGTSMGSTGSDGKVMLESPAKKDGGTFTFTVTSVIEAGYTYNPSLNVETSDSITAP